MLWNIQMSEKKLAAVKQRPHRKLTAYEKTLGIK
jgi:hypothetical protein